MPRKKGKSISLVSSDEDDTTRTILTRSQCKMKDKNKNKNTRRKSQKKSMDIDSSNDDFDIDKDNSCEPTKKVLIRASNKIKLKHKKPKYKKNKSNFCDSSEDSSSDSNESEQSLMSLSDTDNNNNAPSQTMRRRNLERFKNRISHKNNSDNISDDSNNDDKASRKRRKRDYDSDEYNEFLYDDNRIEAAWKDRDINYDGSALECFYKSALGLETETEAETESDSENSNEYNIGKPKKKRRKLNNNNLDRNKLRSGLAENQLKESFGTLPISQDIMGKIAKYLTLIEISNTLVLINYEFCQYFNTDKYWKKFYNSLSKNIILNEEKKIIKQYKLKINNDKKIYKRRLLWYYTRIQWKENSFFDELLKKYIVSMPVNDIYKESYFVDRTIAIKIYLVKQCIIMHYKKRCENKNENEYGIDAFYRVIYEEMEVIMPKIEYKLRSKQFIFVWCDYKYVKLDEGLLVELYSKFRKEWKTQTDIFEMFRFVNQMFIDYQLNGTVKENVKDLEYLIQLQGFYRQAMGNAKNVIKALSNDESTIHNIIDIGDESQCDRIQVSIQSPKIILHQQIKYIMKFINCCNNNGYLNCKLINLMEEMKERNIISSQDEFENIKALIDRNQFRINKDSITCTVK